MILTAALAVAGKKVLATLPAMVIAYFAMFPVVFTSTAFALGPHVLAAIGGVFGSAVRFHILKIPWREYPREAVFAAGLGGIFGQANLPVVTSMLSPISPEMFPVAQGAAIGILMAASTGFIADIIKSYSSLGGRKP